LVNNSYFKQNARYNHPKSTKMVSTEFPGMPMISHHTKFSFLHKLKRFIGFRRRTDSKVHLDMLCC